MIQIETLLRWGKVREVNTKFGPRIVRKAMARPEFWDIWNSQKSELISAGLSVSKDFDDDSKWHVHWWQEIDKTIIDDRAKKLAMSMSIGAQIEIPKPDGLEYMEFQKGGVAYILNAFEKNGVLLADDMGLGKSVQSVGVINALEKVSQVLIICPLTLKGNWERELRKWLTRKMTIGHATADFFPRTDIVLIHYNILHKFPTRLSNYWDLVICDEVHRCGNSKTRQAKAVLGHKPTRKEIAKAEKEKLPIPVATSGIPAKRKLLLSGTPFENRPAQLWPLVNYIAPGLLGTRGEFEKRYCGAYQGEYGWKKDGASNLKELGEKLRMHCMVRRLKRDVLRDLPPKTRQVVELDPTGFEDVIRNEQKVWLTHETDLEAAQAALELAKASDTEDAFKLAVGLLRAKTGLIFKEISRVRHETAIATAPVMIDMVRDELAEIDKIVIFCHHKDVVALTVQELGKDLENDEYVVSITGDTPQGERDSVVQQFQNDARCRIFVGSIRAASEGITLTASSTVRFFENDWTASKMAQASDRLHRIGQRDNVNVKYYILPGTIGANMIQTWIYKEEILEQALDVDKPALADEVTLIPKAEPIATKHQLELSSVTITRANCEAIHKQIRSFDLSRANKVDRIIGQSLAKEKSLNPKQAALAQKLCEKYTTKS